MNKETAITTIKSLLRQNGVEFKDGFAIDIIIVKVGRVSHFLHFTDKSVAIISSVKVGKQDIQTTHIDRWYRDIEGFDFIIDALWIKDATLGYMTFDMKQGH